MTNAVRLIVFQGHLQNGVGTTARRNSRSCPWTAAGTTWARLRCNPNSRVWAQTESRAGDLGGDICVFNGATILQNA